MKNANESAAGVGGLIEEGEALRRLSAGFKYAAPSRQGRAFHIGMSVVFLATAFAGFAPTYYLKGLSHAPPMSALLHVHAFAFTAWLVLLFTQTALVSARRVDLHKRLGIGGALLAAVMVPLGLMTGVAAARHGITRPGLSPAVFLIFPIGQILMFAGFIGAALWKRRQADSHRRLVLLATATLMTPAIARLPFFGALPMVALVLTAMFAVAGMIHDWKSRGRVHSIYIWGALIILVSGPVRGALGHTAAWQSFARFLIG